MTLHKLSGVNSLYEVRNRTAVGAPSSFAADLAPPFTTFCVSRFQLLDLSASAGNLDVTMIACGSW